MVPLPVDGAEKGVALTVDQYLRVNDEPFREILIEFVVFCFEDEQRRTRSIYCDAAGSVIRGSVAPGTFSGSQRHQYC